MRGLWVLLLITGCAGPRESVDRCYRYSGITGCVTDSLPRPRAQIKLWPELTWQDDSTNGYRCYSYRGGNNISCVPLREESR